RRAAQELHQEVLFELRAGLLQKIDRLLRLVQVDLQLGQPVINRLELRLERQRLFEIVRGVGKALLLVGDVAQIIIGLIVAGVVTRNRGELFGRFVFFSGAEINVGQLLARARQRRKTVEQLQVIFLGPGKFAR